MADGFDCLAWIRHVWSPGCSLDVHGGAVLSVLIKHADPRGTAFPSLTTIAAGAKSSRTKVVEAIADLERRGYIQRERRSQGAGHDRNLYRLPLTPPGGAPGVPRALASSTPGVPAEQQTSPPGGLGVVRGAALGSAPGDLEVVHELPNPTTQRGRKRRTLWRFVPEEWQPKETHRLQAKGLNVDFEQELRKFRNHEYKDGRSDADRAFANWLERAQGWAQRQGTRAQATLQSGTAERVKIATGDAW